MRSLALPTAFLLSLGAVACSAPDDARRTPDSPVVGRVTVDSAQPTSERLRRFRATVAERPDTLRRASTSLDALLQRWATAVSRRDTASLDAMVLDRAEFAWLFYPTSKLALPPYEMPPALMWENILANSDAGARRALDRFGGRPLTLTNLRCTKPALGEGANRVHEGCTVTLVAPGDTVRDARVFGSVVERDGRYKFLGYANRL